MAFEKTTLVLGKGELYFAPFAVGTLETQGEIYIGNTPEFTTTRDIQSKPVCDSFDGQVVPIEGVITREVHTARFTTDHIAMQNLAFWLGAVDINTVAQVRQTDLSEEFTVYRGRYYQVGITPTLPFGTRGIESVSVEIGGDVVSPTLNYQVDNDFGRIYILPDAPDIADADEIEVFYERRDVNSRATMSQARELFGSLRYVGNNPVGPNKSYFYPYVKLTPTGDIDHKAADWQRLSFEVEAQRRNALFQYVYIDELQNLGRTVFEYAIEESGISEDEFPFWEDQLDMLTNTDLATDDS